MKTEFERLPSLLKNQLPKDFEQNYEPQGLIKPNDPVLVLANEGKIKTSIMIWGFISEWSQDPFNDLRPRPFNARSETIAEKKLFRGSWRHKRCLMPASGFFEKGHRISRIDSEPFWLAGVWSRWMSSEGSELESCCVLTTAPNTLISPLHNRMPVIITNGLEEDWINPTKDAHALRALENMFHKWNPTDWEAEAITKNPTAQMNLFE